MGLSVLSDDTGSTEARRLHSITAIEYKSLQEDRYLTKVNEEMIVGFIQNLLGCSSTGVLPGKQDITDSCPVAVDTQKSEGEGNLGNPGAPSLNQEVDKHQTEGGKQGENCPVFRTGKTKHIDRNTFIFFECRA